MPDSPKCFQCLMSGCVEQTYRIARTANYHCRKCGQVYNHGNLDEAEFYWKEDFNRWRSWVSPKLSSDKINKIAELIKKEVGKP